MSNPIALHETNPHYFVYQGKPTLLVASAEHYGAVLNGAFDFRAYLQELNDCGNNLTRVFTGIQREFPGSFYDPYNTLAPLPEHFLCPYRRTNVPGANDAQKKFDLDAWDDAFFDRLDAFMREAARQNVIVELAFFCPFYKEALGNATWNLSPYHPDNNINGVGAAGLDALFAWQDEDYIRVQTALVRKLVEFLNLHDNLMYEIMNEPYFGNVSDSFQPAIARLIAQTERDLPKKHLITQNIANGSSRVVGPDPLVSVFNWHYASPPDAVAENIDLNKPIGCNETGFAAGNGDALFRRQAWEFLLAGGALFNNLDFSFAVGNESGAGGSLCPHTGGSRALRMQLGFLRRFLEDMDFLLMRPANELLQGPGRLLAQAGRQYAYYTAEAGTVQSGILIEPGEYRFEVFDAARCVPIGAWTAHHPGGLWTGPREQGAPDGTVELAIRITATDRF